MRKTILLFSMLLVSVAWVAGQDSSRSGNKASGLTTMDGHLVFSADHYRLVDDSGNSVQLQYQANKLTHFVGEQVEVTGKPGVETINTTVDGLASSVDEVPVFQVTSVRRVEASLNHKSVGDGVAQDGR